MADSSGGSHDRHWVVAGLPLSPEAARSLGQQITTLRQNRHLTIEELANQAQVSRNHLNLLEHGISDRAKKTPANPRLSTLVALCEVLGARVVIDVNRPAGLVIELVTDDH